MTFFYITQLCSKALIRTVRPEQPVLTSSNPIFQGGRARPGQLRLSGESPTLGTVVSFTFSTSQNATTGNF
ncbi:unnamed protein product, partial [Nesidiocoris tenuis]